MLVIQGREDFNVPWEEAEFFRAGLAAERTQVKIYDNVNHLLTPQNDPKVSAEILNDLVDWIKNVKGVSDTSEPILSGSDIRFFKNENRIILSSNAERLPFDALKISDLQGRILRQATINNRNQNEVKIDLPAASGIIVVSLFLDGVLVRSEKLF